ncbi:M48 family metalloprotease [Acuticoccus mangrovi]|uniref:M48 family metalloprotease n=1 Tax=Acuticoccus mangrovi TaxID=2796142 RepID=A0A934ILX4_9HYPH|nr:M48 family metalloprotease [Acuticoccus mangrovi]MBJ3777346.1 M48 family metalloprotease [Acuticoccus mangrovi]
MLFSTALSLTIALSIIVLFFRFVILSLLLCIFYYIGEYLFFIITERHRDLNIYSQISSGITLIFVISVLLTLIVIVYSVIVFLFGPLIILSSTRNSKMKSSNVADRKLDAVNQYVANTMRREIVKLFTEARRFYVGAIITGFSKRFILDRRVSELMSDAQVAAILYHEYSHFSEGTTFPYIFLRRVHISTEFLAQQLCATGNESLYSTMIKWSTCIIPDFFSARTLIRDSIRDANFIIVSLCRYTVKYFIRRFRLDFWVAEFVADSRAAQYCGANALGSALVRLSALQLIDSLETIPSEEIFLRNWRLLAGKYTETHPSINDRLNNIGFKQINDIVIIAYRDYRSTFVTNNPSRNYLAPRVIDPIDTSGIAIIGFAFVEMHEC